MKRIFALAYAVILLWCTAMILWRRIGLGLVPTQISAPVVYATVAFNFAIAAILIRRWFLDRPKANKR